MTITMTQTATRMITPTTARRMAITRQRLAGERPASDSGGMLDLVRDLGCLQLDPISAVAPSHLLVLWSRLGGYDPATLDALLWEERQLFEYWAHCASIVLTEDYQLHQPRMAGYVLNGASQTVVHEWMAENAELRDHILSQLRERGPLLSREIEDLAVSDWQSTGWNSGRNVTRMLHFLWSAGEIMVAGRPRAGGQKLWDISERCLPDGKPAPLPDTEVVRIAAERALRALGVARIADIRQHFIRSRYPGLPAVLKDLAAEGRIVPVAIGENGTAWKGDWYVHAEDLPLLNRLADEHADWGARTTLLSPFDNLICDRARTELLWDYEFRIEIYVPKEKRRWGYYVLPILHGDRLIGRIDPTMDRKHGILTINAIYAEPDAPDTASTGQAIRGAIDDLATFLGARDVEYASEWPQGWQEAAGGRRP
jgi:uncharacterized protein